MSSTRSRLLACLAALAAFSAPAVADSLYVSDATLFTVKVFDAFTGAATGQLTPTGGWGNPAGIAVAADGRIYVADNNNNVVYRFNANGSFSDTFISSNLFAPTGLAFGPDGYLYVANGGLGNNSYVIRFNSSGTPVDASPFVPFTTGLFDPSSIVFARDGNLYIADSSNDALDQVVLPGGAFSTLVPAGCPNTPFSNPQGLTLGPDGNLYLADAGFGCNGNPFGVYKYSTAGSLLSTFIAPNVLSTPIDLAFGPDGNLYVTDSQARVARFNGTTGVEMADFVVNGGSNGPLINPTFLAFSGGAAANIAVTSGSGQTAAINTAFASPLVATVTDAAGHPVQGVTVTFTAPSQTGASATFTGGNTAVTNAAGVATSNTVVANGTIGGPYNVVASAYSAVPATFMLTNASPAVNVSGQVTVSATGYIRNRVTGRWSATMTVTNNGSAIAGPVQVVLTNLTNGVTMTNNTGTYIGSPYITVTGSAIPSGGSASVTIQFSNPSNGFISFTPVTYSGSL